MCSQRLEYVESVTLPQLQIQHHGIAWRMLDGRDRICLGRCMTDHVHVVQGRDGLCQPFENYRGVFYQENA